jgi:CheY-like chemotaxis protein/HPt (histidine-containing phosphotransfer) domain-containing protein
VRIRQVLINLIDNAVKFTDTGSVTVSVSSDPRGEGESLVRFAIRDTGIGIDRDKLEAIFEKFTQADASTTRRFGGSGLGLTISRQIVELMGGEIGVESELGCGSTFWFALPLVKADPVAPVEPPRVEPEGARARLRRCRVLVAEDNTINLKVACRMLQKLGCDVDVAENGEIAVKMVKSTPYHVVFMDCQMPVLDGYEATAGIRLLPDRSHTRIVAMTAHALPADRERCLAAGMDDYISKPINVDEVRRVLREVDADASGPAAEKAASDPAPVAASFDRGELWDRVDGDKEALAEFVELLAADGPAYLQSLDRSIATGDLKTTAFVAHTIRGSIGHFAAHGAVEVAKQIEAAAHAGALGDARALAPQLQDETTRLIAELKAWLPVAGAPARRVG